MPFSDEASKVDRFPLGTFRGDEPLFALPRKFATVNVCDPELESRLLYLGRRPVRVSQPRSGRLYSIPKQLSSVALGMKPGRALDFGCGQGREAIWLAANGWEVTAMDRLSDAIERVEQLAEFYKVEPPRTRLRLSTEDDDLDLILMHYCDVWEMIPELIDRLKPGGMLSLIYHSPTHYLCFGSPNVASPEIYHLNCHSQTQYWEIDRHVCASLWQKTT